MKTRVLAACAPGLLYFFAFSCSSPDLCVGEQCGGGDAGAEGGADDSGRDATTDANSHDGGTDADGASQGDTSVPPGCNTGADIAPQSACVTNGNGLFVNGLSGNDSSALGTKESAYRSIGAALAASGGQERVFVCATTYDEHVKTSASKGVYGGFSCATWAYSTANVPKVSPTTAGPALELDGVSHATYEDIELDSIAGTAAGESSIAVFVASTSASFTRVTVVAGPAGPAGAGGTTTPNYTGATASQGNAPPSLSPSSGLLEQDCKCMNGSVSIGGASGYGGVGTAASGCGGGSTNAGVTTYGKDAGANGSKDGAGGAFTTSCANGDDGASSATTAGGAGATSLGALTATGWQSSAGSPGATSTAAQGGGGGSGGAGVSPSAGGGGGGGGCGGCGGAGGGAGNGGGSSFAVLSFDSILTFQTCQVTSATASAGGNGSNGDPGQGGGIGGNRALNGCLGGAGGTGGGGGGGGGGAAGASAAIGYVGMSPTVSSDSMLSFDMSAVSGGMPGTNGSPVATTGMSSQGAAKLDLSK